METKKTVYFPKIKDIDKRLLPFLDGWMADEKWQGKTVKIPDIWPLHYFEYLPDKIEDREIQLVLAVGWKDYDIEMIITIGIFAENTNSINPTIVCEVSRHGGTEMTLYRNNKKIVNFPFKRWWESIQPGYFAFKI